MLLGKTNNKYGAILPFRQAIYFGNFDEKKGRIKAQEKIGYIMPLSMEQHFSSRKLFRRRCNSFRRSNGTWYIYKK